MAGRVRERITSVDIRHFDFVQTLLRISDELTEEETANVKLFCLHLIPKGQAAQLRRSVDVFHKLMELDKIDPENLEFIEEILERIGRQDLIRDTLRPFQPPDREIPETPELQSVDPDLQPENPEPQPGTSREGASEEGNETSNTYLVVHGQMRMVQETLDRLRNDLATLSGTRRSRVKFRGFKKHKSILVHFSIPRENTAVLRHMADHSDPRLVYMGVKSLQIDAEVPIKVQQEALLFDFKRELPADVKRQQPVDDIEVGCSTRRKHQRAPVSWTRLSALNLFSDALPLHLQAAASLEYQGFSYSLVRALAQKDQLREHQMRRAIQNLRNAEVDSNTLRQKAEVDSNTLRQKAEVDSNTLRQKAEVDSNTLRQNAEVASSTLRQNAEVDSNTLLQNAEVDSNTLLQNAEVDSNTLRQNAEVDSNTLRQNAEVDSNTLRQNAEVDSNTLRQNAEVDSNKLRQNAEADSNTLRQNAEVDSNTIMTLHFKLNITENMLKEANTKISVLKEKLQQAQEYAEKAAKQVASHVTEYRREKPPGGFPLEYRGEKPPGGWPLEYRGEKPPEGWPAQVEKADTATQTDLSGIEGAEACTAGHLDQGVITFGGLGSEPGKFNYPRGVVVSPSNEIFVADCHNRRVQGHSTEGVYLRHFPTVVPRLAWCKEMRPHDVCMDANGTLWVVGREEADDHVVQYSTDGTAMTRIDLPRNNYPRGIAVDMRTNHILVTDGDRHEVRVFRPDGSLVRRIRHPRGGMNPRYITVDGEGNILVSDWITDNVYVFDESGKFLFQFGSRGSGEGQLKLPRGICTDSSGHIIVANAGNERVQIFTRHGEFVRTVRTRSAVQGLVVGPEGHLVMTNWINDTVTVFPEY
ncbi:repetitive organellar protein-like [Branchiostoma lanceolatum]|uniref:repetitive organellar protein-like n=1 Tax=Branchiostoma lanceolatum TaxID=7740 RepID=UPI003456F19A